MRIFPLICFAVLLVVGQTIQAPKWAAVLIPRLEQKSSQVLSAIVARAPKGGKSGGGHSSGHSSGDDDDDDDDSSSSSTSGSSSCSSGSSSSSSTNNCLSNEKPCGEACIPQTSICCDRADLPLSCKSTERCVESSVVEDWYKCCPASDFSCDAESSNARLGDLGQYRFSSSIGDSDCTAGSSSGFASDVSRMEARSGILWGVGGTVLLLAAYM